MSKIYKINKKQLIEARKRLSNKNNKGSIDEYNRQLIKEFTDTQILRNRATRLK